MKIIALDSDDTRRARVAAALREGGHAVREASSAAGLDALLSSPVDLAILSQDLAPPPEVRLVRKIRAHFPRSYPYVLLLADGLSARDVSSAYEAGIDADMPDSADVEGLVARVNAVQRLLRHFTGEAADAPNGAAKEAKSTRASASALERTANSTTWTTAVEQLRDAGGKFLNLDVTVGRDLEELDVDLAAMIKLSSVEDELELQISLGCSKRAAAALSMHLFGDDSEDLASDVISELGNVFMGTLKRSFSDEGLAYTGGLPEDADTSEVLRPTTIFSRQEAFVLKMASSRLVVHLGLRAKSNSTLKAAALKEGMVLAKDVFNVRGMRLLVAGTRLSQKMVERLDRALAPSDSIEVMMT